MKWLLVLLGCTSDVPEAKPQSMVCNGHPQLCDRAVNEVSFAGGHNIMSSAERGWLAPNHVVAMPTHMKNGVRGLNLDVYDVDGELMLCHGYCELGSQPLVEGLEEVDDFLAAHPNEVFLITFQSSVDASKMEGAFAESGLISHVYAHEPGEPWPTLKTLIEAQTQVVVFSSIGGGVLDWYHAQWDWWFDNPYSASSSDEFSCDVDRGVVSNDLFNVNHFLTDPIAMQEFAEEVNVNPVLIDHVLRCQEETGRFPNQILVDFASIGDLISVVDELNQVQ
ncbi:MAG: hypothetical protein ACPGTU_16370 [Myxococcota bacterium]